MPTFGELRAMVSRRIQDPTNTAISVQDVGDTINASIDYWKQRHFWFNEINPTVNAVPNDPLIPNPLVPILYLFKNDGVTLFDQSYRYVLPLLSNEEYDNIDIGQIGRPQGYTYRSGRYELYYYPMESYPIKLHGIRDYEPLIEDSDTNDFTELASRLIMFDSMSRIYAEFRQDNESAALFSQAADAESLNLFNRTNNNITTGRMTVENSFGRRGC